MPRRIRPPYRLLTLVVGLLVVLLAGCGDDDTSPTTGAEGATTTTTGSDTDTTDTTDATTTTAPPAEPLFAGVEGRVVLLTPTSGEGTRPLLEWAPVDGAHHYAVYLYAPDGDVYWAWTGEATSVHVGGDPVIEEGLSGPSVAEGMSWAVIANDEDLLPIAVSEQREISP